MILANSLHVHCFKTLTRTIVPALTTPLLTGEVVVHGGVNGTTAGFLSVRAALLLSTVVGMIGGGVVLLLGDKFWSSAIVHRHTHLLLGGVMSVAGLAFIIPGLISTLSLSVSGVFIGVVGMADYQQLSGQVAVSSREQGSALVVVCIIAAHRGIEGAIYAISGEVETALGIAAIGSVVAHATIENIAIGMLYSQRKQKLRGALSLVLIQLTFLLSAVVMLESSLLVSTPVQHLSRAAAGGVLLFAGLSEFGGLSKLGW